MITIVSGFGRCGSTLMMRMLDAGGFPVYGNKVSFEENKFANVTKQTDFSDCDDMAVKILDFQNCALPSGYSYRVIWMKRNYKEQAKSHRKFLETITGIEQTRSEQRGIEKSFPIDEEKCFRLLRKMKIPFVVVNFEDCLLKPYSTILTVANFLETTFNGNEILKAIIPRPVECAADLSIEFESIRKYS